MSLDPTRAARARLLVDAAAGGPARLWRGDASAASDWRAALAGEPRPVAARPAGPVARPLAPAAIVPPSGYHRLFAAAAARTGVDAGTLAAIVGAEAGRTRAGALDPAARNPRSSALGLGQFLAGTWLAEAARPGTRLNAEAAARGWLDAGGRVRAAARAPLLALRTSPALAIEAVADFAALNLARLARKGVTAGREARLAWIAHHLGPGDAARFLTRGLDAARARTLLAAQVGAGAAARLVARAGDAAAAHRAWLEDYVRRKIG